MKTNTILEMSKALRFGAVTLRCPDCGKDMMQERADEDPPNCAIVKMSCDDCHADGERHLIDYFDFNGRQITCDGALVG